MIIPVEILLIANGASLLLASIGALVMMRATVKYQRSIGDNVAQQQQSRVIINSVLFLILIGVVAAGLNLFSI